MLEHLLHEISSLALFWHQVQRILTLNIEKKQRFCSRLIFLFYYAFVLKNFPNCVFVEVVDVVNNDIRSFAHIKIFFLAFSYLICSFSFIKLNLPDLNIQGPSFLMRLCFSF